MGKVNVVREDGSVVTVDEEVYKQSQQTEAPRSRLAGVSEALERFDRERKEAKYDNLGAKVAVGVASAVDSALGGAPGAVLDTLAPDLSKTYRDAASVNEGSAVIGAVTGSLSPVGIGGQAAKLGSKVTSVVAGGAAKNAGNLAKAAGRTAEGMYLGAGARVAGTNMTGDELTVEGLAIDMTIGGVLNTALGATADRVRKIKPKEGPKSELAWRSVKDKGPTPMADAARAKAKAEGAIEAEKAAAWAETEAADAASDAATMAEAKALRKQAADARKQAAQELKAAREMVDSSAAYAEFREAYGVDIAQARKSNAAMAKDDAAYAAFHTPAGINNAVKEYEKVQATLRSRMQKAARGGTPEADADAALLTAMQDAVDEISKSKNAARSAAKSGEYETAATALRQAEEKVKGLIPEGSMVLPTIPIKRTGEVTPWAVGPKLPNKLSDLGAKHLDTIAQMAAVADSGFSASKERLAKLAAELGIEPGQTAADTLTTMHKHLRKQFFSPAKVVDEVADEFVPFRPLDEVLDEDLDVLSTPRSQWDLAEASVDMARQEGGYQELAGIAVEGVLQGAKKGKKASNLLDKPIDWARLGVQRGIGRAMDSGGIRGAVMRVMAGGIIGEAMLGTEGMIAGAAMFNGRVGIRSRIRETFARYSQPTANALERLGPVTAVLAARFPDGDEDPEPDTRKQAVSRMRDIVRATHVAPDALYQAVKPFMGMPGDVAFALHSKWLNGMRYLAATAPKDPGIDRTMMGSEWEPSYREVEAWSHRYEATLHPERYAVRILNGDGDPAGVEALQANWPAVFGELVAEATMQDWSNLSLEQHRGLSMLFGQPMSGLQHPSVGMMIQGQFLAGGMGQSQPQQGAAAQGPKRPVGRPAAVQSPIAGSNVSSLTT